MSDINQAPSSRTTHNTSSVKKRKLVQSDNKNAHPEAEEQLSAASSANLSRSSLAISLRPETPETQLSSPSPPRFVPPHLHGEVLEGSPFIDTVSSDIQCTLGSSPSAAYAGLTLESGEMSGTDGDGADLAGSNDVQTTSTTGLASLVHSAVGNRQTLPDRSSSPGVKRRASELEGSNFQPRRSSGTGTVAVSDTTLGGHSGSLPQPGSKLQNSSPRQVRRVSSDTLERERLGSANPRTVTPGLNDPPTSIAELNGPTELPASDIGSVSNNAGPNGSHDTHLLTNAKIELPSLDEQVAKVTSITQKPLKEGQIGFVVARRWLDRVLSRTSEGVHDGSFHKDCREGEIGPVDNSDLVAKGKSDSGDDIFDDDTSSYGFVSLEEGLVYGPDYEILPEDAWGLILQWYGLATGSLTITRRVVNTSPHGSSENLLWETRPPTYTILKVQNTQSASTLPSGDHTEANLVRLRASLYGSFNDFLRKAKSKANIDIQTKVRIWGIPRSINVDCRPGLISSEVSRSAAPVLSDEARRETEQKRLLIGKDTFTSMQIGSERELLEQKDTTVNENYNGRMTLDMAGLGGFGTIVLEEQIGGPAGGEWITDTTGNKPIAKNKPNADARAGATLTQNRIKPKTISMNGKRSPAPSSGGMMTRGRQRKDGKSGGTTGLTNLGNTCYMNSALQCVRSVEELTLYFLQDRYKTELNPSNPLSHNGEVARQYAILLHSMYDDGGLATFAPRQFKNTIGRFAASFTGWAQQDSQEFLGFLLDGLQEDLNRVHKKPYIEKPDSTDEMINDPEAIRELGEKCWNIYKARNDSVIADLFAGTYKSTLVCPVCDKVSITFDPFNTLTLQLPIESMWCREVFFFPLSARPVRVTVDIDKNGSIRMLKDYVAKKMNVDSNKLVMAEVYKNKFYKVFDDSLSVTEASIQANDDIGIFEIEDVPTNFPLPKNKQAKVRSMVNWQVSDEEEETPDFHSPLADKLLVPLFHRRAVRGGTYRYQHFQLFAAPSYIVINRDEAKDYDTVLRKVLAKVDTMTTDNLLQVTNTTTGNIGPKEDFHTVTNVDDDADSSSESTIKTRSVDGEDGFIDVSMRNTSDVLRHGRTQKKQCVYNVLDPNTFIPPELRNLFVMKFFSSSSELVPLGWNSLTDEREEHITLASRVPSASSPRALVVDQNGAYGGGSVSSSDGDTDNIPDHSKKPLVAMNPDSNSESDDLPSVTNIVAKPANKGAFAKLRPRNKSKMLTYSRKGKNSAISSDEEPDTGPLIRLGEGLILDWTPQGYERCFGGFASHDPSLGNPTWESIDLLSDPELAQRRTLRMNRRKKGVSLDDCLDEFGKEEILSENDAWYCPRCKEHRRASKKFELWRSPDILVIHLKRFSASRGLRDKIDVLVDFPVEGLELGDRVALKDKGKGATYDLFAVDNHYGGLGGGHYTAFAQNFVDKNWYEYNDSHVSRKTNAENVVTTAAYLLFYRRRCQTPLGGEFFAKFISDTQNVESERDYSSRDASPAGDDKRLDDFSHNGSSSALTEAKAAHQVGGGSAGGIPARNDDPPSYSGQLPTDEQTLEGMDLDEDNAGPYCGTVNTYAEPQWSFDTLAQGASQITAAPPGSDEEDLFGGDSDKAADGSSAGLSDRGDRMADFADDEGGIDTFENTPAMRSLTGSPIPEVTTSFLPGQVHLNTSAALEDDDDGPVMEVHLDEGEGLGDPSH